MDWDKSIDNLLDLDGIRYVIDEKLGIWVKFEAKKIEPTEDRPHGIRYSLTLHDRTNNRIMGFDNAHAIEYGSKRNVAPKRSFDHWHQDESNKMMPYDYKDAEKLIFDFWNAVDKKLKKLTENSE
jgi:hypothetical protein